jgi:hypothetical protein
MIIHDLLSDQLMTWSANARYSVVHPTQTTRPVAAANAGSGHAAEGLAHRTLQALGKPGCKCADGPGHGPKYYLSVSFPGRRPQMDYVPQADHADVVQRLANFHRLREIIEEICEINRELLRRREAL